MTRKIAINTAAAIAVTAALTAPASAQSLAETMPGQSPEVTDGGAANDVASMQNVYQGNDQARYAIGDPEADVNEMALSEDAFAALAASTGAEFKSESGDVFGTISDVRYNARGFTELVVDLVPENDLEAERLVVTVQPDNVTLTDAGIVLDMTVEEMMLKAAQDGVRDDATAEITIF